MIDFIKKISSRKLWMAIAGVSTGIAMILGVTESDISTVSGVVLATISAVAYIITEGKIDAERVKNSLKNTQIADKIVLDGENSGS